MIDAQFLYTINKATDMLLCLFHHRLAFERALSLDPLCTGAMTGLAILELNSKKVRTNEYCYIVCWCCMLPVLCDALLLEEFLDTFLSQTVVTYNRHA